MLTNQGFYWLIVLVKIEFLESFWKDLETFVKINVTGNYYNPHNYSVCPVWPAQKGEGGVGGVKSAKALPLFPIPLPVSLPPYPLPLFTDACYTGLYCTCASEVNWQFDSKENFIVRPGWILIEELSYLTSCI